MTTTAGIIHEPTSEEMHDDVSGRAGEKVTSQVSDKWGTATVDCPAQIAAGVFAQINYTFTANHCIDDGGFLLVVLRFASDAATLQFDDPQADNYCSVACTGDCVISPMFFDKGFTRPWGRAYYFKVQRGFMDAGDRIHLCMGDQSQGSRGWRQQTFCEYTFELRTLVDSIATFCFEELLHSPSYQIVPNTVEKLFCIAPSEVVVGKTFEYALRLEDAWGNPTELPSKHQHPACDKEGIYCVDAVDDGHGLTARSNPIKVVTDDRKLHHYWSDLHGQSEESIGTNSIEDYFTFARDYALLDMVGHQANDFQVSDSFWQKINDTCRDYNDDDSFVTFPGYEWSGNTPLGGDRNVWFIEEGGKITRSSQVLIDGACETADSPTAEDLFKQVDGPSPFIHAHVGGRFADMKYHCDQLETAVEIHSAWGTFEWIINDAFDLGYRVGISGTSDGHKGRPGNSYPGAGIFGSFGGLTCHLAKRLTRTDVYEAEMARHFYATTGNRLLMEVDATLEDGTELMMGDIVENESSSVRLRVTIAGTGPIDAIEIRNGTTCVHTIRPFAESDLGNRVKCIFAGAKVRGRDRMVNWDGALKVIGNTITDIQPINFWNPARQMTLDDSQNVSWSAVTTGGIAGVILTLKDPLAGSIEMETLERGAIADIADIGLEPLHFAAGGLGKCIEMWRLPDRQDTSEIELDIEITDLHSGDNPIYIRVAQEDDHMAWSSPIYIVRK